MLARHLCARDMWETWKELGFRRSGYDELGRDDWDRALLVIRCGPQLLCVCVCVCVCVYMCVYV
jgi:hypothetical protein